MNMKRKNGIAENKKEQRGKPDLSLLVFTGLMAFLGTIMIYNASSYTAQQEFGDQFHFLKLHLLWIIGGILVGILIYSIDYGKIVKHITPFFIISIVLLILVLIFGTEINGATRWFEIGSVRLQPSEFAKPILIIYLAGWLYKYNQKTKNLEDATKKVLNKKAWEKSLIYCAIIALFAILIMLQPDMGTTLLILATTIIMYILFATHRYQIHNILKLCAVGVVTIVAAILSAPYRFERVYTYLQLLATGEVADPRGTGYQLHQILIGIGSSGFWGKGFGQSRQRFGYLVENTAFTDSTFAVYLEEFGVISALLLVGLWIFFFFKGYQIARNAPDQHGKMIAIGITIWLVLQTLLNMAANVGIIPITGLPLPFLTYGGSATIVTFAAIGLLLNISSYSNLKSNNHSNARTR